MRKISTSSRTVYRGPYRYVLFFFLALKLCSPDALQCPSVLLCVCVFVYGTLPITPERLFIDRSTEMLWRVTIGCQAVALALWAFNW